MLLRRVMGRDVGPENQWRWEFWIRSFSKRGPRKRRKVRRRGLRRELVRGWRKG
jgi:hypothetical protein